VIAGVFALPSWGGMQSSVAITLPQHLEF